MLDRAIQDAAAYARGGADALVVENFGDSPFVRSNLPPEATAAFTLCARAVAETAGLPLGINALRNDARFRTHGDRCRNDEELDAAVAELTREHNGRELMERLQKAGVTAGVALDQEGLYADPQLAHRGHFVPVVHGDWGDFQAESFGVRPAETPPVVQRPSPLIAEHNEYVIREILGHSAEEFDGLVAEGAVEFYGGD